MKPLRAYFNVLQARLNRAVRRTEVPNFPIMAYVEPTTFCNLKCPACPTGLGLDLRPRVSMDLQLFRDVIDEIGDYLFELWMYNWGEPLLHKQTPEMIAYAKCRDIAVTLSSNLSLKLSDDYLERLVTSGLDMLVVSLDGVSEATYSAYRRRGEISQVRANMLRIKQVKQRLNTSSPHVMWQFLVFQHNEHEVAQAQQLYRDWGADSLSVAGAIMPCAPHDEGFSPSTMAHLNIYHPDHEHSKDAVRALQSRRPCSWLYGGFVLNPGGSVSPCCVTPAETQDFGRYDGKGDFLRAYNTSRYKRARQPSLRHRTGHRQADSLPRGIDGMGSGLVGPDRDGRLVCEDCPIPFRQNDMDRVVGDIAHGLGATLRRDGLFSPAARRSLLAYLLMGAPFWRKFVLRLLRRALTEVGIWARHGGRRPAVASDRWSRASGRASDSTPTNPG